MGRHALIMGSQILGLHGVHNDVRAMEGLLGKREFEITRRIEGEATRDGILDAYRALIGRVADDVARNGARDVAVVIYYSGHGGFAEDGAGRRVQYLLPTDWVNDDTAFRGIVDLELSSLLAQLTAITTNVAVILDCCHSSMLSRGPDAAPPPELVPRVVPGRWTPALAAHLVAHAAERVHITGNPHAVRLVSTEADREAFEADQQVGDQWVRRGLFTRALERVLEEPGADRLSWRGVCDRVREQVLARVRTQRPSVEGPADRVLFTTSELARPDAVVYFELDGKPALRASRILGARVGGRYDVVRRGATEPTAETKVATATITELDGGSALAELSDVNERPQPGALAFPQTSPFPAIGVALPDEDQRHAALRERLGRSPFVEPAPPERARFVIEAAGGALVLTDRAGIPPYALRLSDDPDGHDLATRMIERWAKAEALRELPPQGLADAAIEVTWGCVQGGALVPRAPGEPFRVGELICVRARNATAEPLYLWIFDIGISGKVSLISGVAEGQRIQPGGTLSIGEADGKVVGAGLSWPRDLSDLKAPLAPRRESIVVLAADHPVDVTVFETPSLRTRGKGEASVLESYLRSLGGGATRDLTPPKVPQRYGVRRIDFDLEPARAAP